MICEKCRKRFKISIATLFRVVNAPEDRAYGKYVRCPKCGKPTKLNP